MKNFIIFITIIIFITVIFSPILAASQTKDGLEISHIDNPLFSTTVDGYWYPGKKITKIVTVKNASNSRQQISIMQENANNGGLLADKFNLKITTSANTVLYDKPLSYFFGNGQITLNELYAGNTENYSFILSLDANLDPSFAGKTSQFDLVIGFNATETAPTTQTTTTTSSLVNAILTNPVLSAITNLFTNSLQSSPSSSVEETPGEVKGEIATTSAQPTSSTTSNWPLFLLLIAIFASPIILLLFKKRFMVK